jgi:hypothetical protein
MPQLNDLSRSLVALDQDSTIIAVVELSQSSWLVAGVLPGIERQPQKKLEPSAERLLGLLHRWRDEAVRAGKKITRIALAFEAGRDGFWLARWLNARGVEAHVIHPSTEEGLADNSGLREYHARGLRLTRSRLQCPLLRAGTDLQRWRPSLQDLRPSHRPLDEYPFRAGQTGGPALRRLRRCRVRDR